MSNIVLLLLLLFFKLLHRDFPDASVGKESAYNVGDLGSIPGLERSPGEGKDCPCQYSGLENFMDYIVHGCAKNRTRVSNFHSQDSITHKIHSTSLILFFFLEKESVLSSHLNFLWL